MTFTHKKHHIGWLIPLFISGIIYLTTCCKTVYVGDSGEFSLVFKTLGIAHPPGYPLFTLTGRVFTIFTSFLQPAYSANLMNVLIALCAIPIFFMLFDGRNKPLIAGIITMLWMFSPIYWSETSGVEVYALNLVLVLLLSAFALINNTPRRWLVIAYLLGLAVGHHTTATAVIPPLIFLFFTEKRRMNIAGISTMAALFTLGISVFLYLPVRSALSPAADWGNPDSITRFINHVSALQYHFAASFSLVKIAESANAFLMIVVNNWGWIGVMLSLAGVVIGMMNHRKRTLFFLLHLFSNIIPVSFYSIPDIDPYYLPALAACLVFIFNTIEWVWEKFQTQIARVVGVSAGV